MIKINLLPKTINEKAAVRNLALLLGAVLVAVIVGGFVYTSNLKAQVADMEQKATVAEQNKTEVDGIKKEAETIRASIGPIKTKLDFITAILKYNEEYPALYEKIAKWTYSKVALNYMACDGTNVALSGRCKSLDDLGRYLINMYRATDLFQTVILTSTLPGYPKNAQSYGAAPMMSASPYNPMGGASAGGAWPGGGAGGAGMYPPGLPAGGPQANLAGMGAISTSIQSAPGSNWIDFTVACVLKKAITAPTYSAGGAAAAGQAGQTGGAPAGSSAPAGGGAAAGASPDGSGGAGTS